MEPDRLSWLPDHVIDNILSYLPITDAVGTSVLSSKWNKKWHTLPSLVFDTKCAEITPSQDSKFSITKFSKTVDHVLLLHSGPLIKFKICNYNRKLIYVIPTTDIDRWIFHLMGRSIQTLVLQLQLQERYKIPFGLFSCQSLRDLSLYCCCLKLPTKFEGFKNLKRLELCQVTITQDAFENLISRCPLLESLMLAEIYSISLINIHAPNLKDFDISISFEDISFEDTFQLIEVYVDLSLYLNSARNRRLHGRSSNLLKFFDRQPHIRSLAIHNYFLKYLAAGVVPTKLPTPCIELGCLSLCINFDDLKEISAALCLLRSTPNLRTLYISARNELHDVPWTPVTDAYRWEEIFSKPETSIQVQNVVMHNISGFQLELDFIRFLLLYSPELEAMDVNAVVNVRPELVTELIRFKRASANAEVIYNLEDTS
ncbi:unnamed protein product [Lathyrus sativus]|nr:unnamed protein product [Lathyrus sativus]